MPANQSKGSKVGMISGIVILIAFFLPWVRACGRDLSGYDLASDPTIDGHAFYWVAFLGGAACVALYFLIKTDNAQSRMQAARARLIVAIIGALPVLNVALNLTKEEVRGLVEITLGGYLIALGYLAAIASFFVDRSAAAEEQPSNATGPTLPVA
jgi:hypothetical protein